MNRSTMTQANDMNDSKDNVASIGDTRAKKILKDGTELLQRLRAITELQTQEEVINGILTLNCSECNQSVELESGLHEPPDTDVIKCATCRNYRLVHLANSHLFCEICGNTIKL